MRAKATHSHVLLAPCSPWSTWVKRRQSKSWCNRHQSPIQRALPTCGKFESSCADSVQARSVLVAHMQFWKCLTRLLSPEQIISGKDGELIEAKGMQEACDRSVNWHRFGPGTLLLELLKMLLVHPNMQDGSRPCNRICVWSWAIRTQSPAKTTKKMLRQTLQGMGGKETVTWGGGSSSQISSGICRLWMLLQHELQTEHLKNI